MSFTRRNIQARSAAAVALTAIALVLTGCELGDDGGLTGLSGNSSADDFSRGTGSPALATKNTIRIPGEDPTGNAAGAALTVYPSTSAATRPKLVSVVGKNDWRAAIAMSVLAARPLGAPLLISEEDDVPDVTKSAIEALGPVGVTVPGRTVKPKALVAGSAEVPEKMPRINLVNTSYEKLSLSIDALWITLNGGKPSEEVIVTTADPALSRFALPAGPLAAKTGSPVFFTEKDKVPLATLRAIEAHGKPRIYVVGPPRAISDTLLKRLKRYGRVTRVGGPTPTQNAVQLAAFSDPQSGWGWGIDNPGHGLVIMNSHREMDVAAATSLSAGAAYGPLLLNGSAAVLDKSLENYLLDIQPGYIDDPANGVYNRAWLLGNESAISPGLQAQIDKLAQIVQITGETGAALTDSEGF
ncbi:MAG: cell wall-binding repeat-containing protein [Actinobacteria bacterium]|nr:cell wall-binding repeat-containing protein [Actinomycetota bacterium]